MSGDVRVNRRVTIPADEIRFTFSTAGGPGGQHANRSSTRVDLHWDVSASRALGPRQRARVMEVLGTRIDGRGVLRLSSDRHRSQYRNREDVVARLAALVSDALVPPKTRVPTAPGRAATERRLAAKKRLSEKKRRRSAIDDD